MVPAPGRAPGWVIDVPPPLMDEKEESTPGSECEAVANKRGTKRRLKNRDAARKSRQKQTERADELHQELLTLEASNSALEKEIKALKKEIRHYNSALERHRPFCVLRGSVQVDALQTSTSVTSKAELGETPHPMPSSDLVPSSLFTHAPHSLFSNDTRIELPSSTFSTLHPEDILSVTSEMFPIEDPGAPPLDPHKYKNALISAQTNADGTLKPSQITPRLESLPCSIPVPPNTSDGFFPLVEPYPEELSLSTFLEENDWILSADNNPTTL
ncbi:fos-related antigen 1-like isoform X2 [Syngnathus typhle]|uniref:fos-related antigen 1-like isoform X2 n=1 Tax=Syngnathus typhle TaxID=161592 RepID=UPI002A69BDE8|nr:fos-related antigen 1-like isoform X2 [Syngnathus typhle]